MSGLINEDVFAKQLGEELNSAMLKAAEPLIQEALKDIEKAMREKLAQKLISMVESNVDFMRDGYGLRVTIRGQVPGEK